MAKLTKVERINTVTGEVVLGLSRCRPQFWRERFYTVPVGDSLTDQSFMGACDINNIVARFARTGELPPSTKVPVFDDVTALQGDLTSMYENSSSLIDKAMLHRESYLKKQLEKDASVVDTSAPAITPVVANVGGE